MAYGVGQVQQVPILTPGQHQEIAQERQARQLTLQSVMEQKRAQIAQAQAEAEEQDWLRKAAAELRHDNGKPDLDAIAAAYIQRDPEKGMAFKQKVNADRMSSIQSEAASLKNDLEVAQISARLLKNATPENYGEIRRRLTLLDPESDAQLPPEFDPNALSPILAFAEQFGGVGEKRLTALDLLKSGEVQGWISGEMGAVSSQAQLDEFYDNASAMMDAQSLRAIKNKYGTTYDGPQFNQRADQASLTAQQRATNAEKLADNQRADAAAKQAAAQQAETNKLRSREIAVSEGNLQVRRQEANKPPASATAKGGPDVAAILTEIDGLSQKINTGGGGPQSVISGYLRRGSSKAQLDNDVSQYEALISGMIPMVARAVGHTGVLTQQDVDSVRAMFPKVTDNHELAKRKMATIKKLIGGNVGGGTVRDDEPSDLIYDPKTKSFRKGGQ